MSITITLELKALTRALASDWGPALEAAAIRVGAVAALAYTLGLLAGMRWHQLLAWLQQCQLQLLARLGLPGGSNGAPDHFVGASEMVTTPVVPKPVATTNGAELLPAPNAAPVTTPANVACPVPHRNHPHQRPDGQGSPDGAAGQEPAACRPPLRGLPNLPAAGAEGLSSIPDPRRPILPHPLLHAPPHCQP